MPCFMKEIPSQIRPRIKSKGKVPTKTEAKKQLKIELENGNISPAQYANMCRAVDACVEQKGVHTHNFDHEHNHEHEHEHEVEYERN